MIQNLKKKINKNPLNTLLLIYKKFSRTTTIHTAAWLAQLVERQSAVREVDGSSPDRTNTQGLKITEENVLPL